MIGVAAGYGDAIARQPPPAGASSNRLGAAIGGAAYRRLRYHAPGAILAMVRFRLSRKRLLRPAPRGTPRTLDLMLSPELLLKRINDLAQQCLAVNLTEAV